MPNSTVLDLRTTDRLVPRVATMDGFLSETAGTRGVDLRSVVPLTTFIVRTRNSQYRVIVSRDTSVIVQGGNFFLDPTPGRIDGSSFGGSLLKVAWIGVGMRMEITTGEQRIITSPVRDISVVHASSGSPH